jgi:hypothetical protein
LPTAKQVTFSADPEGLQDMMNKAMHQTMINQAKVLANTIQNCLTETLKKGVEGGYLGPAYFQLNRTPPVFQKDQSAFPAIDDSTVRVSLFPQINTTAPGSSSDSQPIQNQSIVDKSKDPTVTMVVIQIHSTQSNVQDQTFSVQNHDQKYPKIRNQDKNLAGWDLTHDHFGTNISNFFEPQPEEILEVKYPQSYQAMFGGTDCAYEQGASRVCLLQSREQGF